MKDAGYTLAETLVALTIVGFSITGLLLATRLLSQQESHAIARVSEEQALQGLDRALGETLGLGALVTGDSRHMQIACLPRDCLVDLEWSEAGSRVVLDRPDARVVRTLVSGQVLFSFSHAGSVSPSWVREEESERQTDPPTVIVHDGARVLFTEKTKPAVRPDCSLDLISHRCVALTLR